MASSSRRRTASTRPLARTSRAIARPSNGSPTIGTTATGASSRDRGASCNALRSTGGRRCTDARAATPRARRRGRSTSTPRRALSRRGFSFYNEYFEQSATVRLRNSESRRRSSSGSRRATGRRPRPEPRRVSAGRPEQHGQHDEHGRHGDGQHGLQHGLHVPPPPPPRQQRHLPPWRRVPRRVRRLLWRAEQHLRLAQSGGVHHGRCTATSGPSNLRRGARARGPHRRADAHVVGDGQCDRRPGCERDNPADCGEARLQPGRQVSDHLRILRRQPRRVGGPPRRRLQHERRAEIAHAEVSVSVRLIPKARSTLA